MANTYSRETKIKALELYLEGDKSASKISKQLKEELGVDVPTPTIYTWIREEDWDKKLEKIEYDSRLQVENNQLETRTKLAEEHLEQYRDIRERAKEDLDLLEFNNAEGAIRAIDTAIKGERDIQAGIISAQFVAAVLRIIIEEVKDKDLRDRIGIKLREAVLSLEE